jgi:protease I
MPNLDGARVAMIVAQQFEDSEAIEPKRHLEAGGATVTTVGMERGVVPGKKGGSIEIEAIVDEVRVEDFDALVIPGGGAPEYLRIHDGAVAFTRAFVESGKLVASICHGPQLLISADVLRGRTITSVNRIRDDIRNAGGNYVDEAVVVDGNLVSSRVPGDLPAFNEAIAERLAAQLGK